MQNNMTLRVKPCSREKRFRINFMRENPSISKFRLHCTVCDAHLGTSGKMSAAIRVHRTLRVLVCSKCYVHRIINIGEDMICYWCFRSVEILKLPCIKCHKCPGLFCQSCIERNFGADIAEKILKFPLWHCFFCEPEPVWIHRVLAHKLLQHLKHLKKQYDTTSLEYNVDLTECCDWLKPVKGTTNISEEHTVRVLNTSRGDNFNEVSNLVENGSKNIHFTVHPQGNVPVTNNDLQLPPCVPENKPIHLNADLLIHYNQCATGIQKYDFNSTSITRKDFTNCPVIFEAEENTIRPEERNSFSNLQIKFNDNRNQTDVIQHNLNAKDCVTQPTQMNPLNVSNSISVGNGMVTDNWNSQKNGPSQEWCEASASSHCYNELYTSINDCHDVKFQPDLCNQVDPLSDQEKETSFTYNNKSETNKSHSKVINVEEQQWIALDDESHGEKMQVQSPEEINVEEMTLKSIIQLSSASSELNQEEHKLKIKVKPLTELLDKPLNDCTVLDVNKEEVVEIATGNVIDLKPLQNEISKVQHVLETVLNVTRKREKHIKLIRNMKCEHLEASELIKATQHEFKKCIRCINQIQSKIYESYKNVPGVVGLQSDEVVEVTSKKNPPSCISNKVCIKNTERKTESQLSCNDDAGPRVKHKHKHKHIDTSQNVKVPRLCYDRSNKIDTDISKQNVERQETSEIPLKEKSVICNIKWPCHNYLKLCEMYKIKPCSVSIHMLD
uniref:PHD-type domain-containing protein n=2 Tax=Clastoptera arizonana TaxID=38151 RepID=A0A1B6E055_9HEMI